jgi:hypothetical protein
MMSISHIIYQVPRIDHIHLTHHCSLTSEADIIIARIGAATKVMMGAINKTLYQLRHLNYKSTQIEIVFVTLVLSTLLAVLLWLRELGDDKTTSQ